jgi:hypothetical protein
MREDIERTCESGRNAEAGMEEWETILATQPLLGPVLVVVMMPPVAYTSKADQLWRSWDVVPPSDVPSSDRPDGSWVFAG